MLPKVYTPAEVAEILKIPEQSCIRLIRSGQLRAFRVGGEWRVTEAALLDLMQAPYMGASNGTSRAPSGRKRDPESERASRNWVLSEIRKIAPDLSPAYPRKGFVANGKQGVLAVATTPSGQRKEYWFGFPAKLLTGSLPTLIIPILADKHVAFVIPYASHQREFDGLSSDHRDGKKFNIREGSGSYYLIGKGIESELPLARYANAFDRFR